MDLMAQQRLAETAIRSASEITAASIRAYADMTAGVLGLWAGLAGAPPPAGSRRPSRPGTRSFKGSQAGLFWLEPQAYLAPAWWAAIGPGASRAGPAYPALSPFACWDSLAAMTRMLGPWPLAGALMAAGMPSRTAWPTARAGAAALEAADLASRAIDRAYSTYRSDGGHAVAQIVHTPVRSASMAAAMAPGVAAWVLRPWLLGWQAA